MYLASSAHIKQLDYIAVNEFNISVEELMENAAKAISSRISEEFGAKEEYAVFCGKGNNGGDGMLVARNLKRENANVKIYLAENETDLSPATQIAYKKAVDAGVQILSYEDKVSQKAIIIDALLGISISGAPRGVIKSAIDKIAACKNKVISIDVPSGLNIDNGRCPGSFVKADVTYTLALDKIGLNTYPGFSICGRKEVLDIGIPFDAVSKLKFQTHLTDALMVKTFLPKRNPNSHKGDFGKVGIIGGSPGMSGSVCMAAKAALRTGAGMVYLFVPDEIFDIVSTKLDEIIIVKESEISEYLDKLDAIAIGMGYCQNNKAKHIIKLVMQKFSKPVVADADGLNLLSKNRNLLKTKSCPTILTPHAVEFSRLNDLSVEEINQNRIYLTTKFANEYNVTVLLKGAKSIVSSPDSEVRINPTGNSGMATAGSGDVLSGIIAGLLSQGANTFEAAFMGAYIHGLSGDIASDEKTEYSVIASDLIDFIPDAYKKIL